MDPSRPPDLTGVPKPAGRPSFPIAWIIAGLMFAVALVAVPLWFWVSKTQSDLKGAAVSLDEDVKNAKSAGVPLLATDLAPKRPVKDEENAAPLLAAIASEFRGSQPEHDLFYTLYDELNHRDFKAVLRDIHKVDGLLSDAKEAAAKPACYFHRDWDLGPELLFPEIAGCKTIVKYFCIRAEAEAGLGDNAAALADLRTAKRIGIYAASDPSMIPMLTRIGCEEVLLGSVEHCMGEAANLPDIQSYEAFMEEQRPPLDLRKMLKGEAYIGIATIRNLKVFNRQKGDQPVDPKILIRNGMPRDEGSRGFMARHLEFWTTVLSQTGGLADDPARLFGRITEISKQVAAQKDRSYLLLKVLTPVYPEVGDSVLRDEATWRLETSLSKVLVFKEEHGRFPSHLTEAGADAIDPFSGQPIKYILKPGEVRIYSVGQDRIDDHGVRKYDFPPGPLRRSTYDYVAAYPPAKRPAVKRPTAGNLQ